MEGSWRAATDISLRGSFFERSRSSRSKVKFMCFFSVCSPTSHRSRILARGVQGRGQRSNFCISAEIGPICMKLGELIQLDP